MTRARRAARRSLLAVASGAVLLVVGACGVASDAEPTFVDEGAVPFGLLGSAPPGSTDVSLPGEATSTTVCLTGADGLVHPVARALPSDYDLIDLVALLAAGPLDSERGLGLSSSIADPGAVRSVTVEGGVATVDLDPSVGSLPTGDQVSTIIELVCTLTGQPGVGQVLVEVGGRPIDVPRGDGSTTSDPVTREDYADLIAP